MSHNLLYLYINNNITIRGHIFFIKKDLLLFIYGKKSHNNGYQSQIYYLFHCIIFLIVINIFCCHPITKNTIFAAGFPVPSRDKHHDICDLRCLVAGNVAMRSVKISMRCPCLGTFIFPLRHWSIARHSGALPKEVVLP